MRSRWPLLKEDSPICLNHKIIIMKVLDELSFGHETDFSIDDIKRYFNDHIKYHNKTAEFTYLEYKKGSVKYRVIRVR